MSAPVTTQPASASRMLTGRCHSRHPASAAARRRGASVPPNTRGRWAVSSGLDGGQVMVRGGADVEYAQQLLRRLFVSGGLSVAILDKAAHRGGKRSSVGCGNGRGEPVAAGQLAHVADI